MALASPDPVKVSFSFYPADVAALDLQTVGLRKLGVPVRRGTVLRALIEITSETEMFASAILLHRNYSTRLGPRETDNIAGNPTVDLPARLIAKLDRVVTELAVNQISANRAYVVRAILRSAPKPEIWAPAIERFLRDFPRRPRSSNPKKDA